MPSTGAIIASTGASLTGIGAVAWTNPGNITASDNTYATASLNNSVSRWLVATNFNFSTIPDDAVILGVTGTIEAKYTIGVASITTASFVVGDAVVGTQKSLSQAVTTSDVNYTVGNASDLWGYLITPAVLKVSTTGWAVSFTSAVVANVSVDAMYLTVEYAQPGPMYRRLIQKQKRLRGGLDGRD